MMSFSVLITRLLDGVWIILGEITSQSLLGVKGLKVWQANWFLIDRYKALENTHNGDVIPDIKKSFQESGS